MEFQLNEEQKMLKKMVHDLAEKEFRPKVAEWEASGEPIAHEYFKKLAGLGLLGLPIAVEYGGQGRTAFEAILAIEELARVSGLCAGPVFETSVGPVRVIEQFGTEAQKQKYIPPACRGKSWIAVAMTSCWRIWLLRLKPPAFSFTGQQ